VCAPPPGGFTGVRPRASGNPLYLQSVGSSSSLAVPASVAALPGVAARVDQVSQAVDATLNDAYTKYAKLPVVGLSLGYRF
jgi:hypothetical protein